MYCLNFILGGLIFVGIKSAGFTKATGAPGRIIETIWKCALMLMFFENLGTSKHALATSFKNGKPVSHACILDQVHAAVVEWAIFHYTT